MKFPFQWLSLSNFFPVHMAFPSLQLVRYNMQLANSNVRMLQYSTTEIVAPFLLPEIVRATAGGAVQGRRQL